MRKRLASKPAKPRSQISLPGYPTLAAAGLSLCLSGGVAGCMFTDAEPAGSAPAPYQGDAAEKSDSLPPPSMPDAGTLDARAMIDSGLDTGTAAFDSALTVPDPSNMAGGEPYLFVADAGDETTD